MPEGPELFLASLFINSVAKSRLFGGRVVKSEVSTKNPNVKWDCEAYRISAVARGKELKVTLMEGEDEDKKNAKEVDIIFRFGMSGSFKFTPESELPKHAHLRFFTIREEQPMVLSFVDYRRFGHWVVGANWSRDRGPDPMWEYEPFRDNVLSNLNKRAFNKPICETLLNQKFFNGIGNYLRAEILYRCGVRPFDESREVLEKLEIKSSWYESKMRQSVDFKIKKECDALPEEEIKLPKPDILDLCHIVPKEVINLEGGGKGYNVDLDADEKEYASFKDWLQCYNQDGMENLVDSKKRTIWFSGDPGKLVPKGGSSRQKVNRKSKKEKENTVESKKRKTEELGDEGPEETKKKAKTNGKRKTVKEEANEESKKKPASSKTSAKVNRERPEKTNKKSKTNGIGKTVKKEANEESRKKPAKSKTSAKGNEDGPEKTNGRRKTMKEGATKKKQAISTTSAKGNGDVLVVLGSGSKT